MRDFVAVPEPSSTISAAPSAALADPRAAELGARLRAPRLEDRPLGARGVVLGELGDPVEQLAPARVVEVLGLDLLERTRQPVEDVVGERALVAGPEVGADDDGVGGS